MVGDHGALCPSQADPRTCPGALSLTGWLLCPEMKLQVEVFDHVAQLVIVRVLPELQEEEEQVGTWALCPLPTTTWRSVFPGNPTLMALFLQDIYNTSNALQKAGESFTA